MTQDTHHHHQQQQQQQSVSFMICRRLQLLIAFIVFVPLSSGNIVGVVSTCCVGIHIIIGMDVSISHIVGCDPSCRDKYRWEQSGSKCEECWCMCTGSIKQTFQLLLCVPARKFVADPFDKINQDFSGLAEVFLTVPCTTCSVSTPVWININLQKWDEHCCYCTAIWGSTSGCV